MKKKTHQTTKYVPTEAVIAVVLVLIFLRSLIT